MSPRPRLTIGLITYNGANHVGRAIDSILNQTFEDFQLLIFDNASTDGTTEICARRAALDTRVRHVRHAATIPQSANFRGVLYAADTELFMWATDDDLRAPTFVKKCVEALDNDPSAVAACTEAEFADAVGARTRARGTFAITGTAEERVKTYLHNPRDSCRLFGVYRTEQLKRSYPRDVSVFGYDWLVVALSMLEGAHLEVPGVELTRAANPPGKYFERYDRHFSRSSGLVGRLSHLFPLLPLSRELRRYLPRTIWVAVRLRVLRLLLHQTLLFLRWKYPRVEPLFVALRGADRTVTGWARRRTMSSSAGRNDATTLAKSDDG